MFFRLVYNQLCSNLKGKKLAIFGTAFKKGTCDARESPSIDICKDLLIEGAVLHLVDPKATRDNVLIGLLSLSGKWNTIMSGMRNSLPEWSNSKTPQRPWKTAMQFWSLPSGTSSKLFLTSSSLAPWTSQPTFSMEEISWTRTNWRDTGITLSGSARSTLTENMFDASLWRFIFYISSKYNIIGSFGLSLVQCQGLR